MADRGPEVVTLPVDTFYLIVGDMRTGTSLLCGMLEDTPEAGKPREYIHPYWGWKESLDDYVDWIRHDQPGRVVGIKMFWNHLAGLIDSGNGWLFDGSSIDHLDLLVRAMGARKTKWIFMTRNSKSRQAASVLRAETANRWSCPAGEQRAAISLPRTAEAAARVEELKQSFLWSETEWNRYFKARGIMPLRITYEQFTASELAIAETYRMVCSFLGVQPNEQPAVPLKKQAGREVEEWIEWYRRAS